MPRGKQSKGQCTYCKTDIVKNVVTKHLATCPQHLAIIQKAAAKKGKPETLFHLRVQSADSKDFWIDIEMRGSKTLQDLDNYLRAIWLECCGHLSEFSIGAWTEDKFDMDERIADVFSQTTTVTHLYDFGTTSETNISLIGTREGHATTSHPLALMVRNLMPEAKCTECGEPATEFCMECVIEEDQPGYLCDEHATDHPHDSYGEPFPIVNSPRMGMCGYEGPAEAPY